MSEPFIAEVRIFAGNFAIRNWAFCNGQLLPIAQNTALFSLVGTIYGGDGRTTFGLPNLQGRAPLHAGRGPGLSSYRLGQKSGSPTASTSLAQTPSHGHTAQGSENSSNSTSPTNHYVARGAVRGSTMYQNTDASLGTFKALANKGGGQPHNNMQPYLALNFIIALQGLYPSRS